MPEGLHRSLATMDALELLDAITRAPLLLQLAVLGWVAVLCGLTIMTTYLLARRFNRVPVGVEVQAPAARPSAWGPVAAGAALATMVLATFPALQLLQRSSEAIVMQEAMCRPSVKLGAVELGKLVPME